jgi:hypothetical protein
LFAHGATTTSSAAGNDFLLDIAAMTFCPVAPAMTVPGSALRYPYVTDTNGPFGFVISDGGSINATLQRARITMNARSL